MLNVDWTSRLWCFETINSILLLMSVLYLLIIYNLILKVGSLASTIFNKQQILVKCPRSLYGRLIQKTHTGASFIPGWLFYFVSRLHDDGLFHITVICLKVHFMSIKYTCDSKSQTLRMRYRPIQFTCKPISHWHRWSFRVYMILLRNFVPEWISSSGTITRVNLRWGDSRRHDILWWYHVNKFRAIRGN